jgi:hypothetical protein
VRGHQNRHIMRLAVWSGFKNTVTTGKAWAVELRASVLGCRSPKPRGISPPIFHPGYRFY